MLLVTRAQLRGNLRAERRVQRGEHLVTTRCGGDLGEIYGRYSEDTREMYGIYMGDIREIQRGEHLGVAQRGLGERGRLSATG